MNDKQRIGTGGSGTVIAAICCFTPVLAGLLGVVGLSAWLGWLDDVLFPALAIFLGILACGIYRHRRKSAAAAD